MRGRRERNWKLNIDGDCARRASVRYLNQIQLARRWSLSPRTLERWRWLQEGPKYVKVGGRILYRLEDIEAFEKKCLGECRRFQS
jgi:Helix-turn-helix domain